MEKFTVDLDKVLDEFEFNEEQAFHQENFKNEDLPAKRYQKPHFQPINMADADFSPSLETTMSFTMQNRKHSEDSTNSSTASDNVSCNCKFNDVTHNVTSDLIETSVSKSYQKRTENLDYIESESNNTSEIQQYNTEDEHQGDKTQDMVQKDEQIENKEYKEEVDSEEYVKCDKELSSINTEDEYERNFENSINNIAESHAETNLIVSECNKKENDKEGILQLPVLTDSSKKEHFLESGSDIAEDCAVISNEKGSNEISGDLNEQKVTEKIPENESELLSPLTDEDCEVEKSEVKPIQFESENNISDEDLYRYLEELEVEERKAAEAEVKPVRPDFLHLNEKNEPERNRSPGQTPLPKDMESLVEMKEEHEVKEEQEEPLMESATSQPIFANNAEQSEENEFVSGISNNSVNPTESLSIEELGKVSPFWMPDHLVSRCMDCDSKFTVIKRRHHCRACGRILCSKCCGMRASLEYLQNQKQRVCSSCFMALAKVMMHMLQYEEEQEASPTRRPNPNNPMEYCSTVPPPLQVSSSSSLSPPSVLVPVGVLKREGTSKVKENTKQVMFSDGIRPGGDLTDLDGSSDQMRAFRRVNRTNKRVGTPPGNALLSPVRMLPPINPVNQSFIPEKGLPPVCIVNKGETTYQENWSHDKLMERLKDESLSPLTFSINRHLIVSLQIVKLDCCMNKTCWVFCTKGMECVGQDEILILLTLKDEADDVIPRDVFLQLHCIYQEASKGNTITELGCWCVLESGFLDSQQHGGFLFIRPTYQCLKRIEAPPPPFLVGVLIHRSEIPWARVFPIRLMLRLGAEFRYYPCPLVSVRFREPVYYEIGHTIIKLLADFRNFNYTLPNVRGLRIHVEVKQATILIPRNRYDQIVQALNNSNEPVLALAGNFSKEVDAHLVCTQLKGDEITYKTQTININKKPRQVTGASFVVLNGGLKSTSGLTAKKSFVEDGLLVQVPNETMTVLRNKLRNMEDWSVKCGPIEGDSSEEVKIVWCEDDKNFNIGVKSVIDNMALDGIPSIRTHNFIDCMGSTKFIRWTQVFIIRCEDGATSAKIGDPLEVNKLSENIARATCLALKKLLDLLAASGLTVLAVRATIDQDNVGYEAGSNGEKLPPIYMNSLDNELIPVLHKAAFVNDSVAVLELVFHIMEI